jgi:pyruvate/2-oxoglutarate dehydrogenase complex dihydrolipoamide acyltransferase (E2) component
MALITVIIPKTGAEMEEARIVSWKKQEGDSVEKGDILAEIETDKALMDLESPGAGVLIKRYYQEGETAPATQRVAVLATAGEKAEEITE